MPHGKGGGSPPVHDGALDGDDGLHGELSYSVVYSV